MGILGGVVVSCIFLTGFFLFYLRYRFVFYRRAMSLRLRQLQVLDGAPGQQPNDVPHGLERAIVAEFPLMRYASVKAAKKGAADVAPEAVDCAVCLTEFQEDEKLRILPSCRHGFHADCIDMWLLSHSTCPLCRVSCLKSSTSAHQLQIVISSSFAAQSVSVATLSSVINPGRDAAGAGGIINIMRDPTIVNSGRLNQSISCSEEATSVRCCDSDVITAVDVSKQQLAGGINSSQKFPSPSFVHDTSEDAADGRESMSTASSTTTSACHSNLDGHPSPIIVSTITNHLYASADNTQNSREMQKDQQLAHSISMK